MRVLLVKPRWFVHGGIYRYLERTRFTPLNLCLLAALSDGHDVTVIDGDWEDIPFDKEFDVVGITSTTFTSQRAYDIAARFRRAGAKVVIGGVHATLAPEECARHADAVVVGEADGIWPEILRDVERNSLKSIYRNDVPVDMNRVPPARRELLSSDYWVATVQATRGCPNSCRFCYLPNMPWHAHRKRDVGLVREEVSGIRQRLVYIVDDNLFADEAYAERLFDEIAPFRKDWSIQAPTTIGRNPRMVEKMARSGCFLVQVGFQTANPRSLNWARILQNRIEEYRNVVELLHRNGIGVQSFWMFGFDHDDTTIFQKTVEMIRRMEVDDAYLYILTPYPGTEMYEQFRREGRLMDGCDRTKFGWANAVFRPARMSAQELERGVQESYRRLHSHFRRMLPRQVVRHFGVLMRNKRLLASLFSGNARVSRVGSGAVR